MSHDDLMKVLEKYTALLAGSTALYVSGQNEHASVLREMATETHATWEEGYRAYERDRDRKSLARLTTLWDRAVPQSRRRDPREKTFAYRVTLRGEPDQAWLVDHVRVPFAFSVEEEGIVFASRCHREAMAVKMRFG